MSTPEHILQTYFGYNEFRPGQKAIVSSIIDGQDTFAILPTGGGKSICYQVPGLLLQGTTVVVSPLISLMKDQVDALLRKNIAATYINSSLEKKASNERLEALRSGKYRFVYVSPERLQSTAFKTLLAAIPIPLVAVDEAHCISGWGHDFRPEYRQVPVFFASLPQRPIIAAFTASAPPAVQKDIVQQLQMQQPRIFLNSFRRTNLHFCVHQCACEDEQYLLLLRTLRKHEGEAGIIYANTRQKTEDLATFLQRMGIHAKQYHGGMPTEERMAVQEKFLDNSVQVITATNAFGMGVDKPNVRFVFHFGIPADIENYYQEAGRAGRDGAPAQCYFFPTVQDYQIQLEQFERTHPPPELLQDMHTILLRKKSLLVWQLYKSYHEHISKKLFFLALEKLKSLGGITFSEAHSDSYISVQKTTKLAEYRDQYTQTQFRLQSILNFVIKPLCKTKVMLDYFGETFSESSCGQCDICTNKHLFPLETEHAVFHALVLWKKKIVSEARTFSEKFATQLLTDKVLGYLSVAQPRSLEKLARVPGVGTGMLACNGPQLLEIIENSNVSLAN